jgi:subtilisin family serine protease
MTVKTTKAAEPNRESKFAAAMMPATGSLKKQWYLKSWKASQLIPEADINAPEAWKITRGDRKIVVAIIDGGFDLNHPDLNLPGKIVFPTDYVKGKKNSVVANDGGMYHGTMCAGLAVAESNSKGMLGIANGCSFMPVRIPPDANDDLIIKIFEETAAHADVISCSWAPPPVYAPLSAALYNTLKRIVEKGGLRKKGSVICFSASNYNAPINDPDNHQFFWLDKQTGSFRVTRGPILNGYAAHPDIITVSASTSLNKKAAYSNWGKEISVCAPSDNYHPLVEDSKNIQGRRDIWTTKNKLYKEDAISKNNGYTKDFGGTSCATALVAGVAALVLSVNQDLTAVQVKNILQDTADKIEDAEPDMILGKQNGFYINGHSWWFGYGKINAAAAVRRAKEMPETK